VNLRNAGGDVGPDRDRLSVDADERLGGQGRQSPALWGDAPEDADLGVPGRRSRSGEDDSGLLLGGGPSRVKQYGVEQR
jgi:hypothetical protein